MTPMGVRSRQKKNTSSGQVSERYRDPEGVPVDSAVWSQQWKVQTMGQRVLCDGP